MAPSINFDNFVDGNAVNYSFVLIKGRVISSCDELNGSIWVKNSRREGENVAEWPVFLNYFKAVVRLQKGWNNVVFTYEMGETVVRGELNLKFQVHDTELCLLPLYILCEGHDGRFQGPDGCDTSVESACRRVGLGSSLIQCLFAEKLYERGLGRKSFQLEADLNDSAPQCRVFYSSLAASQACKMSQIDLWEELAREIMLSEIGSDSRKYLGFLACTSRKGEKVLGDPALGGGGLALLGSGTLYCWPESLDQLVASFTNDTTIDRNLVDNSCFRGTYGACFSTSLGAACHELGHIFNLGHTHTGIMARGFDHVHRVFTASTRKTEANQSNFNLLVPCLSVASCRARTSSVPCKNKQQKNAANEAVKKTTTDCDDDMTHFTISCAVILSHHRWFNCGKTSSDVNSVCFDNTRLLISSEYGLKVIQLRDENGLALKSWEVGSKAPRKHFVLPRPTRATSVFAIDSMGSTLSTKLKRL